MLSRRDIQKELGKELSIFPLRKSNIKENSINVTISKYAWCKTDLTVYWYDNDDFTVEKRNGIKSKVTKSFKHGDKAIFEDKNKNISYLLLFPHQTTVVETEEVIAIGNQLGGAVHSKVGIVAQGIGDTGTMLGPGYCGHLMISLHNITNDIIAVKVGTTFVSLTFDYLNTQVIRTSATVANHYDRLLEHKFNLSQEEKDYFSEDWKTNQETIRQKMIESKEYKEYRKEISKNTVKEIKKYFNKKNIIIISITIFILILLGVWASYADSHLSTPVWIARFWNIGFSGVLGTIIINIISSIKGKK